MNENQELSLQDLLYVVLKGWRLLLSCVLILSVLFTGHAMLQNATLSFDEAEIKAKIEALAKDEDAELLNLKKKLEDDQKTLNSAKAALQNSILLNLDPEAKPVAKMTIAIELTETNRDFQEEALLIDNLVRHYTKTQNTEELAAAVNHYGGYSISQGNILELTQITIDEDDPSLLLLTAAYKDEETARGIAYAIFQYFEKEVRLLTQTVARHALTLEDLTTQTESDASIAQQRQKQLDQIADLEAKVADDEAAIDELAEARLEEENRAKLPLRLAIGIVLGLMIAIGWIFADAMLHGRIRDADDVRRRIDIPIIGTMILSDAMQGEKKKGAAIDAWLDRLFGKDEPLLSPQESQLYTAASLGNRVIAASRDNPQKEVDRVLCTGSEDPEPFIEVLNKTIKNHPNNTKESFLFAFDLKSGPDPRHFPQTLLQLGESDAVVLVEQERQSRFRDLEAILEQLSGMGKPVLGLILVKKQPDG